MEEFLAGLLVLFEIAEVAVVRDVGDNVAHQAVLLRRHVEVADLFREGLLQRLGARSHVLHGVVLAVALFVKAVARGAVLLVEAVLPVAAERIEAVEVAFVVAHR